MTKNIQGAIAFPPGDYIREELSERDWTQKHLARLMGRPEQTISLVVNGKKSVTPEIAIELGDAFGTSAELWLGLEMNYQLYVVRRRRKEKIPA